ncbi:MAG: tRNA (adenosine(37)-N6)-threonylcarbamoyltransferase complex ATPase subunit type 1 TsaE [Clostridiaceae bacterium]|nr:tRNA (adenosine(37)-N6)-threonylcarbamoyltransferase complex ATPase subunit type 1 TsaE [Clostridiaceae bacterium]
MYNFISKSEQDTITFAKDFAKDLKKGDIIVLTGELRISEKLNLHKVF